MPAAAAEDALASADPSSRLTVLGGRPARRNEPNREILLPHRVDVVSFLLAQVGVVLHIA